MERDIRNLWKHMGATIGEGSFIGCPVANHVHCIGVYIFGSMLRMLGFRVQRLGEPRAPVLTDPTPPHSITHSIQQAKHSHVYTCVYMYIHLYVFTYIYRSLYIHTYITTYISSYMYIYISLWVRGHVYWVLIQTQLLIVLGFWGPPSSNLQKTPPHDVVDVDGLFLPCTSHDQPPSRLRPRGLNCPTRHERCFLMSSMSCPSLQVETFDRVFML